MQLLLFMIVSIVRRSARAASFATLLVGFVGVCAGQSTIFVSRHADRFGTEPDPSLTPIGMLQAQALARLLVSANVRHIYTTELLRTRQTAAPIALKVNVRPIVIPQTHFEELIARIRASARPNESTLVIGHRHTVPKIVKALTGRDIPALESNEYGRLVIVTLWPGGSSSVVTVSYGESPCSANFIR
jgi:broad specificity phosphatase PhoE